MREILVVFTLLASYGFFNYHDMVSVQVVKALIMFFVMLCACYAWLFPSPDRLKPSYPRVAWLVLGFCMLLSVAMAFLIHGQPLVMSVVSCMQFIFPLSFFTILLWLNPDPGRLLKYFYILVGVSILIYFVNFRSFPNTVFGATPDEDLSRGILRIRIPFFQLLILMFFYSINKFSIEKKTKWLIFIGIGMVMIILSVIRQAIVISFLLGFLLYMQQYNWYKKILIGTVLAVSGIIALTHIPFYKDMMELSESQYENSTVNEKEDVRIGAWRYYAYESQNEYPGSMYFGNGSVALGKCDWGNEFESFMDDSGYLMADVSWSGFYFQFGIFAVLALMYIVIASIFKRKTPGKQYLSYFMAAGFLQGIASGVWYYSDEILIYMVALYLIYRPDKDSAPADAPAENHVITEGTRHVNTFVIR